MKENYDDYSVVDIIADYMGYDPDKIDKYETIKEFFDSIAVKENGFLLPEDGSRFYDDLERAGASEKDLGAVLRYICLNDCYYDDEGIEIFERFCQCDLETDDEKRIRQSLIATHARRHLYSCVDGLVGNDEEEDFERLLPFLWHEDRRSDDVFEADVDFNRVRGGFGVLHDRNGKVVYLISPDYPIEYTRLR